MRHEAVSGQQLLCDMSHLAVPCDTGVGCSVKARVSIQQRWHSGLLLVRVFGKLFCHPPSSPPPPTTPPPPFSSANFSLRILLLLQM